MLIGLVGEGVGPSLTPPMHELEGARHGMHYVYRTIDLAPGQGDAEYMAGMLAAAQRLGFNGLNITHPVKQTVMSLVDRLAPSAASVGALNTVVFGEDGIVGHNTDVTGFSAAFEASLGDASLDRVVVVGTGGAGAAVASALANRGIRDLVLVDADIDRARTLAASLEHATSTVRSAAFEQLTPLLADASGVVNATPMGMAAHPGTAIDPVAIDDHLFVVDIVYRPVETELLRIAKARGCRVMSGLGMVMHQAADAFEIFTGERADRHAMLTDLQNLVANEAAGSPIASH